MFHCLVVSNWKITAILLHILLFSSPEHMTTLTRWYIYYLLKLYIISIIFPFKKNAKFFLSKYVLPRKVYLCGGTINFCLIHFFVISWEWFVVLNSNVAASTFTSRRNKQNISIWALPFNYKKMIKFSSMPVACTCIMFSILDCYAEWTTEEIS